MRATVESRWALVTLGEKGCVEQVGFVRQTFLMRATSWQ
jgi:hypothetical protein